MELVEGTFGGGGDEPFPDAGGAAGGKSMRVGIPVIEAADDSDVVRVGSPDAEDSTLGSVGLDQVCAHFFVEAIVAAFVEQVKIFGGQQGNVVADRGGVLGGRW